MMRMDSKLNRIQLQGQPSGYKTFYKVQDVNSSNTSMRIFKANRKSSALINKELANNNIVLRVQRIGSDMDTVYKPFQQ